MALLAWAAAWFVLAHGWVCYYGDAEAHLNIARRIVDSQTPGFDQLGTPWLPLPHLLLIPLVKVDRWWRSGLAGVVPGAVCFALAGIFLFASVQRLFGAPAAAAATAAFALNPNLLYLSATPMSEPVFWATLTALLYCTVRFGESRHWVWVVGAGLASLAAVLTRYDGWFLIPFVMVYFFFTARRRIAAPLVFGVLVGSGILFWLSYNWWETGDALYFFRGPGSAAAIQGNHPYPGKHDWGAAWFYYQTAVQLVAGKVLAILGVAGLAVALARRVVWPVFLLALPAVFYMVNMHSGGSPIFLPVLWPHSYYNSRYATESLPLLALGAGALAGVLPARIRPVGALALILASAAPWLIQHHPGQWVVWEESRVNSISRRAWTQAAADYLAPRYRSGSGIITSSGDVTGIYRAGGIPLREIFNVDNGLLWQAAVTYPYPYMWQEWAVGIEGDEVDRAATRSGRYGLEQVIAVEGAPPIHIYRRTGGAQHGNS